MKAIDFVVRDNAGGLQRGTMAQDAAFHEIQARTGQEISLNLRQTDLQSQVRDGDDLIITLADGRVITIDNFFNGSGDANRLFVSADGYLNEVSFVEMAGGNLSAQYGPTEQWGKWSPSDDLIYLGRSEYADAAVDAPENEVSMLGAALLGGGGLGGAGVAAGVVGGGALLTGLSGGGEGENGGGASAEFSDPGSSADDTPDDGMDADNGDGGPDDGTDGTPDDGGTVGGGGPVATAPFVNDAETSTDIGGDDTSTHTLTVTGGGNAGDAIEVTVGDQTQTGVIDEDGNFEVTFQGDHFPQDGDHETQVVVTTGGGLVVLDGPGFVIDTTAPRVEVTQGTQSVGDFFNAESFENGVVIKGTGEVGATVELTIQGVTRSTTVNENGNWSARWQAGTLEAGEYTSNVAITTTDAFGNSRSSSETLVVDTITDVSIRTADVEIDGVVNAAEASDGVSIRGTAQPGAVVDVEMNGFTHTVTANASGRWTVDFAESEIPAGEYTPTITATATDSYGNVATATGQIEVDTLVNNLGITSITGADDGVINAVENSDGITVTGTTEVGSTSVIVGLAGSSVNASVDGSGNWVASFPVGTLAGGTYDAAVSVTAMDAAGNSKSISQTIRVDTEVVPLNNTSTAGGADDVVNAAEAAVGVDLGGKVEVGSTVVVSFDGTDHTAVVDASGNWAVNIPASAIRSGTYDAAITITATDAVGNIASLTDTLAIDTDAPDGPVIAAYTRDGDGFRGIAVAPELEGGAPADGITTDVAQVNPDGSVDDVVNMQTFNAFRGETNIDFAVNVPDGSDIVVTNADDAGNTSGTYLALDDETVAADIDLSSPALGNYQIETVDLQFAEEAHLTIDEDALVALSTNTNTLLVKGGGDDKISITGGTKTGTTTVDGDGYDVYSVGEGTVIVDEDINVI